MDKRQQEFLQRLRETFRLEADEHVRAMSSGIFQLEKGPATDEAASVLEVVFREAHSLKGAARAVNLLEIESVCQALESVFAALKRGEIGLSAHLYDRFHFALGEIGNLLSAIGIERGPAEKLKVTQIVRELGLILNAPQPPGTNMPERAGAVAPRSAEKPPELKQEPALKVVAAHVPPPQPEPVREPVQEIAPGPVALPAAPARPAAKDSLRLPETVRISTAKLNSIMLQTEEMLAAKLTLGQRVTELREVTSFLVQFERERAKIKPELRSLFQGLDKDESTGGNGTSSQLKGSAEYVKAIAKIAGFSQSADHAMKTLQAKFSTLVKAAEQDHRSLSAMVDRLLEDTRKALMLPFSIFLEAIPMLVRDLARDSGKEVGLVIRGGETEVDRRILEEMKDPVVHLVRNCIDHGIEKPAERARKHKPSQATITIMISQQDGGKLEILISDDGAGINVAKVRASAVKAGTITAQEAAKMDDGAAALLIFRSGVSTSPMVTDLSGRGLGLAIVREKVDKLGGSLAVDTRPDAGTRFRISLPLTLAAFRGVLVRAEEQLLIVPSAQVVHTLRQRKEKIKSVENRDTLEHAGKVISLVRLSDVLGVPRRKNLPSSADLPLYILILTSAEQQIAFVVDEILEEQEVLVKSLGQQLPRVKNISGAAVLGTGKVVPVLNVSDLMQSALNVNSTQVIRQDGAELSRRRGRLLVAEDSITTRTLLKNILESAGYMVKTAVDGVDALTWLRSEEFDLVVSDVDMPRMNGFGLTSAIRTDKRLSELPVVLVTALDSKEDRERGIDVGASAYIVKGSFEQSNLLEVVRRLV